MLSTAIYCFTYMLLFVFICTFLVLYLLICTTACDLRFLYLFSFRIFHSFYIFFIYFLKTSQCLFFVTVFVIICLRGCNVKDVFASVQEIVRTISDCLMFFHLRRWWCSLPLSCSSGICDVIIISQVENCVVVHLCIQYTDIIKTCVLGRFSRLSDM